MIVYFQFTMRGMGFAFWFHTQVSQSDMSSFSKEIKSLDAIKPAESAMRSTRRVFRRNTNQLVGFMCEQYAETEARKKRRKSTPNDPSLRMTKCRLGCDKATCRTFLTSIAVVNDPSGNRQKIKVVQNLFGEHCVTDFPDMDLAFLSNGCRLELLLKYGMAQHELFTDRVDLITNKKVTHQWVKKMMSESLCEGDTAEEREANQTWSTFQKELLEKLTM